MEDFIKLIDMEAVDMIHPDLASAGGLLETKKIGDYAMERGVPMAMRFAHLAHLVPARTSTARWATENFIALEHHSIDVPWWEQMVRTKTPLIEKGFAPVPEEPGLGIDDLVPEVIKQHLHPDHPGYFEPTPEWDRDRAQRPALELIASRRGKAYAKAVTRNFHHRKLFSVHDSLFFRQILAVVGNPECPDGAPTKFSLTAWRSL